jgi:DNA processing protein
MSRACPRCLARSWLLARLSGHLEVARSRIDELLALDDLGLIAAVAGRDRSRIEWEYLQLDAATTELARLAKAHRIELLCRCDPGYPAALRALTAPPSVLHVAGGLDRLARLCKCDPVAIVGSRSASAYGTEVARSLGRDLAAAGVTVLSGMARGIDAAAHAGALCAGGASADPSAPRVGGTIAVLPGSAEHPYPASQRTLYRSILGRGVVVSELPCGAGVRKWCFLARNRLIAGLAKLTVVVEAGERSGALLTAAAARELERPVGAVPGRVTSAEAAGSNALLAVGAHVIRGAQDALDCLYGVGTRSVQTERRAALDRPRQRLLQALAEGEPVAVALARVGIAPAQGLAVIAELELGGWLRRRAGGSFVVIP